jgi:hypothetical protein
MIQLDNQGGASQDKVFREGDIEVDASLNKKEF